MNQTRKRTQWLKRAQSGQSIVILAIGFIALLGFVGIVTDVSLLFVRYSSLRRAVDAAAIAAAGQMRRDLENMPAGVDTESWVQSTSTANVNLAAREYLQLYGLDPSNVTVETCYTQTLALTQTGSVYDRPVDRAGVELYVYNPTTLVKTGDNPLANEEDRRAYEELCTDDELKLVRVTAQIQSPTVFLRLLGFPTITLEESAISQTAVIEIVMIFDVSNSMSYSTSYEDWENPELTDPNPDDDPLTGNVRPIYPYHYVPPFMDQYAPEAGDWWNNLLPLSFNQIETLASGTDTLYDPYEIDSYIAPYAIPNPATDNVSYQVPRSVCQVRPWPASNYNRHAIPSTYSAPLLDLYSEYQTSAAPGIAGTSAGGRIYYNGYVPTYDYFGCCNDPNGDGLFTDMVCQPMRDIRNSAESFLERLDFIRGDRVAFVTYDRGATLIDPDGAGPQRAFIETLNHLGSPANPDTERRGALEVLREVVGVRAEDAFYVDELTNDLSGYDTTTPPDGLWDGFRTTDAIAIIPFEDTDPTAVNNSAYDDDGYYNTTAIGSLGEHPVRENCPLDRAYVDPFFSHVDYYNLATQDNPPLLDHDQRVDIDDTLLDEIMLPTWMRSSVTGNLFARYNSYEQRASCASGNLGGALQAGNSAFTDPNAGGRLEGSVWIMVLLSDGAAGASDPVYRRNAVGLDLAVQPQPYNASYTLPDYDPGKLGSEFVPIAGEYGSYGLCPMGTQTYRSELTRTIDGLNNDYINFPWCSDEDPSSRHYCSINVFQPNNRDITLNEIPGCEEFYDVDDYARDWADFVGLTDLVFPAGSSQARVGNERLPSIFTIGFSLDFSNTNDNPTACASYAAGSQARMDCSLRANNLEDYLGEELLRYVADVGDNNRIDSDFWQQSLSSIPVGAYPLITSAVDLQLIPVINEAPNWGARGPCETGTGTPGVWSPLSPATSCGNYFNVAQGDTSELDAAFTEIANRMFTRLSG